VIRQFGDGAMIALESHAGLHLDRDVFRQAFDQEPFGFTHRLSELDMFEFGSLRALSKIRDGDLFVASGAPTPGTVFYSVPHSQCKPLDALDRLETGSCRVLLKRPENYDPRLHELLDALFRHVVDLRGGLGREKVVRLQGSVLISSAATTTPFHFDPEIGFFLQIEGETIYHVYSPTALSVEFVVGHRRTVVGRAAAQRMEVIQDSGVVHEIDIAGCDSVRNEPR
jgi:hypothetical protein